MAPHEHIRSSTASRIAVIVMMVILFAVIPAKVVWTAQDARACLSATGEAAVTPCRRALLRDPGNMEIRFALSETFMALRRYADAVSVLREGLERFPGDDEIKKKLILAESFLEEQQWIEKQQKSTAAASRSKKQDTQLRLSIIRCKTLKGDAAIAACDEGLRVNPTHPELLTGRGNVWLEMDRLGKAIADYEAALATNPKFRDANKNLRLARTRREVNIAQCLKAEGQNGLNACDAALLKGASDEFSIERRRAQLLQAMGRDKEAIEAYRVAARLNPGDARIKQALAVLTPRSEKPTPRQAQNSAPIATTPTGSAAVKSQPATAVAIQQPAEPVVIARPPKKITTAKSEPPINAPPAKTDDLSDMNEPVQQAIESPPPFIIADSQPPRQYSNAPEAPGMTH